MPLLLLGCRSAVATDADAMHSCRTALFIYTRNYCRQQESSGNGLAYCSDAVWMIDAPSNTLMVDGMLFA